MRVVLGTFLGTVGDAVRVGTELLRESGVDDTPKLDAELLVGHVVGCDRAQLRIRSGELLDARSAERIAALVQRRAAGEPIAYLLGTAWFYGREFLVDHRVLVPRPETELLVELALQHVRTRELAAPRILDVGTGSGCLAVTLAAELPDSSVTATDISPDALDAARQNAQRLGVAVAFQRADLLDGAVLDEPIDVVVANPPYVDGVDADGLEPGVRDHEPHVALFVPGGETVDAFYGRLAEQAQRVLAPGGMLAVEHGRGQRALVVAALERAGFADVAGIDDLAGIDRVVHGRRAEQVD